jgi:ribonuclease T1
MKTFRFVLLIALALFVAYVRHASVPVGAASGAPTFASPGAQLAGVPQKALDVLAYVRQNGHAPEGYVGGRVFENREGRLPAAGDYREFDVDPHQGQRNADRLIVEWNTKQAWYTDDHYRTFIPMP